jgi:uncharacterized protein (UPF0332 family)
VSAPTPKALSFAYLDRAWQALRAARVLIRVDDAEAAINRAYYACFYAALGALAREGERPKTHSGVRTQFAKQFVATGLVPSETARILGVAAQTREEADYDALSVFDVAAASDLLADAERFVRCIERLLTAGLRG